MMILSICHAEWKNATGISLRSFRCTKEEGWGTVCTMWGRHTSTQKGWEHQRFGFKLVSSVKHLFLNLKIAEYGKVRTRVITCPGVLGAVPVYAYFPSASSFSPRSVLICMLNYMVAHLDTVFEALPLTRIVTSDKLLYLFELHMPHLAHKIVVKIQWGCRWQSLSPVLAQKKDLNLKGFKFLSLLSLSLSIVAKIFFKQWWWTAKVWDSRGWEAVRFLHLLKEFAFLLPRVEGIINCLGFSGRLYSKCRSQ